MTDTTPTLAEQAQAEIDKVSGDLSPENAALWAASLVLDAISDEEVEDACLTYYGFSFKDSEKVWDRELSYIQNEWREVMREILMRFNAARKRRFGL